jgi:drug/metabolite transporter (DMT)-like permease
MTDLAPPRMSTTLPPIVDWIGLWSLVAMWGSAYAAVKIATLTLAPPWLVAVRMAVATLLLAAWALAARERVPALRGADARAWLAYGLIGAWGMALPFNLFAWASTHADSALLGIINGASPLFTALIAAAVLADERLSMTRLIGIGLGFLGLLALAGPAALGAFGAAGAWAVAAGAAGTLCYAVSNVATRKAAPVSPVAGGLMMCAGAAVAAIPAALLLAPAPQRIAPDALAAALALGIGPTGIATAIYVFLVKRRGPMFVANTMYLSPLWATALGMAALGERPGPAAGLALILILAGVYIGNRPRKGHA